MVVVEDVVDDEAVVKDEVVVKDEGVVGISLTVDCS